MHNLKLLQCQQCGASLQFTHDRVILTCVFCHSSYLLERPAGESGPEVPGFVRFERTALEAIDRVKAWIGAGWFCPGDLAERAEIEDLVRVFLPYRKLCVRARSHWTAEVTRTEVEHRRFDPLDPPGAFGRVRRRETSQLISGGHEAEYPDVLIPASERIPERHRAGLGSFDVARLEVDPRAVLEQVVVEEPDRDDAAVTALARSRVEPLEWAACAGMVPGGEPRGLKVNTRVEVVDSGLVYLPVYLGRYIYRASFHDVYVNGQTGRVTGERERSVPKISAAVGALVTLPAAAILWLWRRRR